MENTEKVLFEDDTKPVWYIAIGQRWIGPLSAADVYKKILAHEITWAHYVWKPGQTEWRRVCDVPTFQAAVPGRPEKEVQVEVKHAAVPAVKPARARAPAAPKSSPRTEERAWFLYYNDSQFGPFSTEEIRRFLRIGKIHGRVHAWRDGMKNWERLERIEAFGEAVEESKAARARKKTASAPAKSVSESVKEQRSSPRRPLIARIMMAHDQGVNVAVCRDISVGGMQVLTDCIPGKVGARLKLNISPPGDERGGNIKPFVADGTIVRILEDGRGFSFRFNSLPNSAQQAIEDYIRWAGQGA